MFLIDWVWNEIIAFKLLIVRPFTFLINVRSLVFNYYLCFPENKNISNLVLIFLTTLGAHKDEDE